MQSYFAPADLRTAGLSLFFALFICSGSGFAHRHTVLIGIHTAALHCCFTSTVSAGFSSGNAGTSGRSIIGGLPFFFLIVISIRFFGRRLSSAAHFRSGKTVCIIVTVFIVGKLVIDGIILIHSTAGYIYFIAADP